MFEREEQTVHNQKAHLVQNIDPVVNRVLERSSSVKEHDLQEREHNGDASLKLTTVSEEDQCES